MTTDRMEALKPQFDAAQRIAQTQAEGAQRSAGVDGTTRADGQPLLADPNPGDRSTVSSTAAALVDAMRRLAQAPEAPPERLQMLHGMVESGSLPIDVMRLAQAILEQEGHVV